MKKIKKIKLILLCIIALYACNKFLDKQPIGTLSPDILYDKKGVEGLLIGAYSLLDGEGGTNSGFGSAASNWVYGSICADDAYKGSTPSDQGDIFSLEIWDASATNSYPPQKWDNSYDGVQRANEVLRALSLATDVNETDAAEITAEARFLRGFYHFELKKIFGNVPFIGENVISTTTPDSVSNIDGSGNYVNIWPQIEADFQYASDNLPEVQSETGRANKWAAMAFLAKAYMFQSKYDQAKPLLDDIIQNGVTSGGAKYALINYEDNFNPATNHGDDESFFAAQMSVNDGSADAQGPANGNYGETLNFPYNAGPGGCCGFFNPSQSLANAFKTNANGLPLLDGSYNNKNDIDNHTNPYTGTLDPRIDWAIGRPGIPYLDWGIVPVNDSWIRNDQGSNGRFVPKKNVYAKSQSDTYTESGWGQLTSNNVNLIRYADVLLWAAECEVQTGDPNKGLEYVNMVRNRAADKVGWVYKYNDNNDPSKGFSTTPAGNYLIKPYPAGAFSDKTYAMNAVMFERRLEFAMEGHRFFDLQREDRGTGSMAQVLNAYAAYEHQIKNCYIFNTQPIFVKGKSELFPIPQDQIDVLNANGKNNLKQNPGY